MELSVINFVSFITILADAASEAGQADGVRQRTLLDMVPFILIFVAMYYIMIRPTQKRAKAHTALSDHRGLLISYNVNSFNVNESLVNADIYRPRFIRVSWKTIRQMAGDSVDSAMSWQPIPILAA